MSNKTSFRKIFVAEPSHDVSGLKAHTDEIVFVTTGYQTIEKLPIEIAKNLEEFNPQQDAFVPLGKLVATFLISMFFVKKFPSSGIWIAIYRDKEYTFVNTKELNDGCK
jgi:hypothetical protein